MNCQSESSLRVIQRKTFFLTCKSVPDIGSLFRKLDEKDPQNVRMVTF